MIALHWKRYLRPTRRWAGGALALAGIGLVVGFSHPFAAPRSAVLIEPPSVSLLQRLLPRSYTIEKTETLRFKGQSPLEVVVATRPQAKHRGLGRLYVDVVAWDARAHRWHLRWQSPALNVQRGYPHRPPMVPAISAWQVQRTARSALVGVLTPESIGADTLWNDGLVLWVTPKAKPKVLWVAQGGRESLADGALTPIPHGIRVIQYACGATDAVQTNGKARVVSLSCTNRLSHVAGQRLGFTVHGAHVDPSRSTVTVAQGRTVVFWPANAATAKQVNQSSLGLYGGYFGKSLPPGKVPLAAADALARWSYTFSRPGTYYFAIVSSRSSATVVPALITVHVLAKAAAK